ncbi:MAG TPA: NADP-dependent oxidoreductase [Tepidisphaeraceae bacterium]|jgi:NADPH:quinone reductase-like Zn-dependent oxidoreductase
MKAVRLHQRGGPEQIVVEEAPRPAPAAGEVRVRVRAAAITPGELTWDATYQHADGSPRLPTIPGHDVAGIVDVLGPGVTDVAIGDAVYALVNFPRDGSAAEYVVIPAGDVAPAPRTIDPVHAAAVPLSALTAWQGLFDHGRLAVGQRALIHGASGGVGGYAVQLAHWHGAHVIATASARNAQSVRNLGAEEVIDYATTRFEDVVRDVDLVFDTVGGDMLARSFAAIRPGGTVVSIAGVPDKTRAADAGVTGIFFIVRPSRADLQQIASLIDAGHLRATVQEVFPLARAREAFVRSMAGHLTGKIVLRVDA